MEVILLEKVGKFGNIGSVVRVKDGFGRNFLLPRKKAIRATKRNLELFEARRQELELENNAKREAAEALLAKLADVRVTILRQAGEDGRLFGSVTARDVSAAIKDVSGIEVDHAHIVIEQKFKQVGSYSVNLVLHPEVTASVSVDIVHGDRMNDVSAE